MAGRKAQPDSGELAAAPLSFVPYNSTPGSQVSSAIHRVRGQALWSRYRETRAASTPNPTARLPAAEAPHRPGDGSEPGAQPDADAAAGGRPAAIPDPRCRWPLHPGTHHRGGAAGARLSAGTHALVEARFLGSLQLSRALRQEPATGRS